MVAFDEREEKLRKGKRGEEFGVQLCPKDEGNWRCEDN